MKKKILIVSCFLFAVYAIQAKDFMVTDFGAVADTSKLSTQAFQKAIDECSKKGGKVLVPAGNYKTGTLYLRSNVTINFEKGATLYGSPQLKDYPENVPDFVYYRKGSIKRALIYAENCTNIAIEGEGTINGQGERFWVTDGKKLDSYSVRPYLFWMVLCKNIRVEGMKLRNSALWMQHYLACENLYVHNIDVFNHCNKNNDMIDIDGCKDVRISDCVGDTDDDGITMKTTSGRANENIVVTNCILSSHCNALKMGTESVSGFKNVTISNIVIRPSLVTDKSIGGAPNGHTGIALETVDGGDIQGILINNIRIDGPDCPIFLKLGNRARPYYENQKIEKPGSFQDVTISNIIATGANEIGCSITGIPNFPIKNVRLQNISIEFKGGGTLADFQREIPEKEKSYPEYDMFDILPSYGFFVRHAENIQFSDIQLTTKAGDLRPAVVLSDVREAVLNNVSSKVEAGSKAAICLEKSEDVRVSSCSVKGKTNALVHFKGSENKSIKLIGNTLTNTQNAFTSDNSQPTVVEFGNVK
jgi:polygalacturonase